MIADVVDVVGLAACEGLRAEPKRVPAWLFYDEAGSQLFERITELPEYYLTRTERALLREHADELLDMAGAPVTIVELGAGTATKTGLLLAAAAARQGSVLYQPIDVSPTALEEAREHLEAELAGVTVRPQEANYITEPIRMMRQAGHVVLALYIGSSIGNFSPEEGREILAKLRAQLRPGDLLLLGTDLAPDASPGNKTIGSLLAAYDDAQGVTAAFNRNVLTRLNREAMANFNVECYRHEARWNAVESRVEMHLVALSPQVVTLRDANGSGPIQVTFAAGESIHTENSYKFTTAGVDGLLIRAGFRRRRSFVDGRGLFAVTLASAV